MSSSAKPAHSRLNPSGALGQRALPTHNPAQGEYVSLEAFCLSAAALPISTDGRNVIL
ncbi:MAG: hypothetical protein M9935_10165 [Kiritimatiellae bacterium]|nr:hypothetical protein [Kiritimatiellia bacterium]